MVNSEVKTMPPVFSGEWQTCLVAITTTDTAPDSKPGAVLTLRPCSFTSRRRDPTQIYLGQRQREGASLTKQSLFTNQQTRKGPLGVGGSGETSCLCWYSPATLAL